MKERPIIFSGELVGAILDGRKSQTRRVIKPQPPAIWNQCKPITTNAGVIAWCFQNSDDPDFHGYKKCPYGVVGDKLWVRETWRISKSSKLKEITQKIIYKTDEPDEIQPFFKWKSPRFMFKKYARLWLEIKNIRAERVQDISEEDCFEEGINLSEIPGIGSDVATIKAFSELWDSLNAKRGYGWLKNPFVWVIEFKVKKQGSIRNDR